jgi:predicted ATP-grasp superfamily ATP-dependent carboligase
MTPPPPILVLDGEQRSALAVVRSLGRRGYPVHVGSNAGNPLAGGSRYAASEHPLPDPVSDPAGYARAVLALVRQTGARVLFALSDAATLSVLEHRDRLGDVAVPSGDLDHFRRAADKQFVLRLASAIGIDVPPQWIVDRPGAPLPPVPAASYPLVLKPARSVAGESGPRIKVGVTYASDPPELHRRLEALAPLAYPVLLQQRVTGPGIGVFLLRWNGSIRAAFAHRRLREFPPSGGVSVACESIPLPEALGAQATALLEALEWQGVAMVEFKQDLRSGRFFLMEVNPRFWGSLQLAIDAGVDFPWYLTRLALGFDPGPAPRWTPGVRSRWEWGECNYLIARLRGSRKSLHLPDDAPGLLQVLSETVFFWRPHQRGMVFRCRDPVPFVRESVNWFRALRGAT